MPRALRQPRCQPMHSQRWIQRGGGWVRSRARELSAPRRGRLHAASQLARKQMQARPDRPLCAGLPMCAQSSVQLVRAGARCVPAAASPSRVRQPFWMEPSFMSFLWCQSTRCGYARPAGRRAPSPNAARWQAQAPCHERIVRVSPGQGSAPQARAHAVRRRLVRAARTHGRHGKAVAWRARVSTARHRPSGSVLRTSDGAGAGLDSKNSPSSW